MQATVSAVIQAIEERFGIVGTIIGSLFGAAWSVVTFLTVPIIVFEDVGPVNALKRSGTLLKQTWGENIIGQGGLGLLMLLPMLVAFGIGALGVVSGTAVVAVPLIAVAVVLLLLVATVIVNALSGIYRTALYRYAVDGQVPAAFAERRHRALLRSAGSATAARRSDLPRVHASRSSRAAASGATGLNSIAAPTSADGDVAEHTGRPVHRREVHVQVHARVDPHEVRERRVVEPVVPTRRRRRAPRPARRARCRPGLRGRGRGCGARRASRTGGPRRTARAPSSRHRRGPGGCPPRPRPARPRTAAQPRAAATAASRAGSGGTVGKP